VDLRDKEGGKDTGIEGRKKRGGSGKMGREKFEPHTAKLCIQCCMQKAGW